MTRIALALLGVLLVLGYWSFTTPELHEAAALTPASSTSRPVDAADLEVAAPETPEESRVATSSPAPAHALGLNVRTVGSDGAPMGQVSVRVSVWGGQDYFKREAKTGDDGEVQFALDSLWASFGEFVVVGRREGFSGYGSSAWVSATELQEGPHEVTLVLAEERDVEVHIRGVIPEHFPFLEFELQDEQGRRRRTMRRRTHGEPFFIKRIPRETLYLAAKAEDPADQVYGECRAHISALADVVILDVPFHAAGLMEWGGRVVRFTPALGAEGLPTKLMVLDGAGRTLLSEAITGGRGYALLPGKLSEDSLLVAGPWRKERVTPGGVCRLGGTLQGGLKVTELVVEPSHSLHVELAGRDDPDGSAAERHVELRLQADGVWVLWGLRKLVVPAGETATRHLVVPGGVRWVKVTVDDVSQETALGTAPVTLTFP